MFVEPETGWTSTTTPNATLFDASGAAGDVFGSALAISGDANHILVGAPFVDEGPGRVSTFDMPAGGWTGTLSAPANLTASDSTSGFGVSVSISGNGSVAAIGTSPINEIGEAYVFTPCVSLDPRRFDFGNVLVGKASPPKTFTLSNSCPAVVTNIDISFFGDVAPFSQNNTCGSTLLGNDSCDINVTFTPSSAESFLAALLVNDSDTSSNQNATLAGTGVCGVSLAPGSFDFGNINVGNISPPTAFTLSNQCTTDVTGVAISFSGANSADFSQNNTCGGAIPAGASCTINVTFAPSTGSAESANLVVAENDPSSPQQATLTGTGVPLSGDFSITPTDAEPPTTPGSTTSATVSAGSSATYALSVKSLGRIQHNRRTERRLQRLQPAGWHKSQLRCESSNANLFRRHFDAHRQHFPAPRLHVARRYANPACGVAGHLSAGAIWNGVAAIVGKDPAPRGQVVAAAVCGMCNLARIKLRKDARDIGNRRGHVSDRGNGHGRRHHPHCQRHTRGPVDMSVCARPCPFQGSGTVSGRFGGGACSRSEPQHLNRRHAVADWHCVSGRNGSSEGGNLCCRRRRFCAEYRRVAHSSFLERDSASLFSRRAPLDFSSQTRCDKTPRLRTRQRPQ